MACCTTASNSGHQYLRSCDMTTRTVQAASLSSNDECSSGGPHLHVQVVGGLVQQQDVRVAQRDGREHHARLRAQGCFDDDDCFSVGWTEFTERLARAGGHRISKASGRWAGVDMQVARSPWAAAPSSWP